MAFPVHANNQTVIVEKSSIRRGDIPSLDGLRTLSIMLVLEGHGIVGTHSFGFAALFLHADLGVRIFFIISGYLITTLLLNEDCEFGSISLRAFYIRRALRILPAFFLFTACVALLGALGMVTVPAWYWLYVFTYTVNFSPVAVWALGHLWSLSVEEQFYLLWPLVVKVSRTATWTVVPVVAIFASPATYFIEKITGNHIHMGAGAFPIACGPIAMGCLLAIRSQDIRSLILSSKFLSSGRMLISATVAVALLDAIPNHFGAFTVFLRIIVNSVVTLCIARLVFITTDIPSRILNSAPAVLCGKLSYSLYLWQQLFLNPDSSPPIPIPFPFNFVAIFTAASACYWGVEVRFLGLRRKFRKLKRPVYAE